MTGEITLRGRVLPIGGLKEKLLAAQSMMYSKIIKKDEQKNNLKDFPHIRDELACIHTAKRLSFQDCGRLFPLIRRAKSTTARQTVTDYLATMKSRSVV